MKRKAREFNELSPIPAQPRHVLSGEWETPQQIHARTGLSIVPLCEQLINWWKSGSILHAEIRTMCCTLPVFKEKTLFDSGRVRVDAKELVQK
jgi:NADH:ubiquinone oxidoreductase subunit B-like Fe-S oxidoreductase